MKKILVLFNQKCRPDLCVYIFLYLYCNLNYSELLNEKIVAFDDSLSRGVLKKDNAGANGIYNQDFDPNTILIEVGGQYNNIEEVNNSLKVFASIIYDYLKGEAWKKRKIGF